VSNFNVVDKQGQANVAGEGHLHFYLDVDAPTAPGQPAIPAGGYLVVAKNAARLRTNYANLNASNCLGDYSGRLGQ
jgi:hypothetical protein